MSKGFKNKEANYKNMMHHKSDAKKADDTRKKVIVELMESDFYVPMKEKELAIMLQVEPEDRPELSRILNELLMENKIVISKRGKYTKAEGKIFTGTFRSSNKGYGFVSVDDNGKEYFIGKDYTLGAFHGDIVMIAPTQKGTGDHEEAKIIKIVERTVTKVVGSFEKSPSRDYGFVVTDNKFMEDIFISGAGVNKAKHGQKVVVM